MVLACCGRAGRCFANRCTSQTLRVDGKPRMIYAKYEDELKFALRHAAALSCPGAHYQTNADSSTSRDAGPRDAAVQIALPSPRMRRWHPDPRLMGRAIARQRAGQSAAGRADSREKSRTGADSVDNVAGAAIDIGGELGGAVGGSVAIDFAGVPRISTPAFTHFVRLLPPRGTASWNEAEASLHMLSRSLRRSPQHSPQHSPQQSPHLSLPASDQILHKNSRASEIAAFSSTTSSTSSTSSISPTSTPATVANTSATTSATGRLPTATSANAPSADADGVCPGLPRHWWPRGAVSGYCEETSVARGNHPEGDCEHGANIMAIRSGLDSQRT
mmetsp:Transcript_85530/g.170765  ORF Transcript_85530/g.170765 Transcript_85530/m.170765 type:complete len:332 (-) Transcript_85530:42-1037(-)